MINIPPIKSTSAPPSELISDVSKTWKVGQVLHATSPRGGEAMSKVLVQLGEHTLQAKTPVKLEAGQDIRLLVKSVGDPASGKLPLLSILPMQSSGISTIAQTASLKLRQFIAVQQAFSQTLSTANTLLQNRQGSSALPRPLLTQLNQLQTALQITPQQNNPAHLKQLVENSGIFLEAKLKNNLQNSATLEKLLSNDFKQTLLTTKQALIQSQIPTPPAQFENARLSTEIKQQIQQMILGSISKLSSLADKLMTILPRPVLQQVVTLLSSSMPLPAGPSDAKTVAELISQTLHHKTGADKNTQELINILSSKLQLLDLAQQVDRSISQLSSFQLQPLSREADSLTLLLFNLILKDQDEATDLHVRIEQETRENEKENESWTVSIHFHFKTLGKMQADLHLLDKQVSAIFSCEADSTSNKVRSLLPQLEHNLRAAGFRVAGTLVKTQRVEDSTIIPMQTHLLDENI